MPLCLMTFETLDLVRCNPPVRHILWVDSQNRHFRALTIRPLKAYVISMQQRILVCRNK